MKEIGWRKSARVSEKLVSPGLPGLKVATPLYEHKAWAAYGDTRDTDL